MRQTKPTRVASILVSTLAALALVACSSSQQDEEALDAQDDQQANLGEDDAAEGNGQENYVDNQGGGNNQYAQDQGADVNSDTSDEEMADTDPTLNGAATDVPVSNPAPMNAAPMNAAPMNTQAAAMPMQAASAPAAATAESPIPGGRVRYVREGGIQVMNAPNGTPVLTLDQGEHPVTWEENGWLRITNGMYVPADAMSDKGVPRSTSSGSWTH